MQTGMTVPQASRNSPPLLFIALIHGNWQAAVRAIMGYQRILVNDKSNGIFLHK